MSNRHQNILFRVITASSVGTLIEWYDFYLFGTLASILSLHFFPTADPAKAYMAVLATFAAGFVVRPFGALIFGWLGDLLGRRRTFLLTLSIMGGGTILVGTIPGYASWGYWSPLTVLFLRILQGLALGGEYGGAATYVSEHAPTGKKGFYTSFIQTSAPLGLLLSFAVILIVKENMTTYDFESWGWRIPFWISAVFVAISMSLRLSMKESPLFAKLKSEGKISANPIMESFTKKENLKMVAVALFGAVMGQGVIWYTGQFYAQVFIQKTMHIDYEQSLYIMATALLAGTPLYVLFGALSDKAGRKTVMMSGMFLALLCYRPLYKEMFLLSDVNRLQIISEKTIVRELPVTDKQEKKVERTQFYTDGSILKETYTAAEYNKHLHKPFKKALFLSREKQWLLTFLVFFQIIFSTMVFGPIAAFLVELFPTRIRYSSMSLPYHIGNGVFGGLTPVLATRLVYQAEQKNENLYYLDGLWYPIIVTGLCFCIGMIFIRKDRIAEDDH